MSPTQTFESRRTPPSSAQQRIIAAALDLFSHYGVGGTSLQMIADEIGVTKAAVYHQYNTKDEIIAAVAEAELSRLEAAIDSAEAESSSPDSRRDAVIDKVIDLAIDRRHQVGTLLNDPLIRRLFLHDKRLRRAMDHLSTTLIGPDGGSESRLATAMLTAAISGAVMHPMVVDLDDDTLRTQLRHLVRRFLSLPD